MKSQSEMTTPTKAKTKAQLQADFDKAVAEYDKVTAPAWAEYDKVRAAAWAEYEKARDAAWDKALAALNNYQPKKKAK